MTTPKTGAPEWSSGQASPHATVNEQARRIEAGAGHYVVVDKDLTTPPGACADGATYIVAGGGGAWAGHIGDLAVAVGTNAANGWYFRDPEEGVFAYVQDENTLYVADTGNSPVTWSTYSPGGVTTLDGLSDVMAAAPADGQVLTYDTTSPVGWKAIAIPWELEVAASDESTALTAGTAKVKFRTMCAVVLTDVRASLSTAQTGGGQVVVDVNEGGSTILSTKLTFDNGATTTVGSSPSAVISDPNLADNAEISIDIDNIGDGTAKGLKVQLIGYRA